MSAQHVGRQPLGPAAIAGLLAAAGALVAVVWLAAAPCTGVTCASVFEVPASASSVALDVDTRPSADSAVPASDARALDAVRGTEASPKVDATAAEPAVASGLTIVRAEPTPECAEEARNSQSCKEPSKPAALAPVEIALAAAAAPGEPLNPAADSPKLEGTRAGSETSDDSPQAAAAEDLAKRAETAAEAAEDAARAAASAAGAPHDASTANATSPKPPDGAIEHTSAKSSSADAADSENESKKAAALATQSDSSKKASADADDTSAPSSGSEKASRKSTGDDAAARAKASTKSTAKARAAQQAAERKQPEVLAKATPPVEVYEVPSDLSGVWDLRNAIDTTTYRPYLGLRLGYRIQLQQQGSKLVGTGEKLSENGRALTDEERTPIYLEGRVEGQTVILNFSERWDGGTTGGTLSWQLAPDKSYMRGRFASNAAKSSGISSAQRVRSVR